MLCQRYCETALSNNWDGPKKRNIRDIYSDSERPLVQRHVVNYFDLCEPTVLIISSTVTFCAKYSYVYHCRINYDDQWALCSANANIMRDMAQNYMHLDSELLLSSGFIYKVICTCNTELIIWKNSLSFSIIYTPQWILTPCLLSSSWTAAILPAEFSQFMSILATYHRLTSHCYSNN